MGPKKASKGAKDASSRKRSRHGEGGSSSGRELVVAKEGTSQPRRRSASTNTLKGPGGKNKSNICPGVAISITMLSSLVYRLLEEQKMIRFFGLENDISTKLVKQFYKNLIVRMNGSRVSLMVNCNGVEREYSSDNFLEDFGLGSEGYAFYEQGTISDSTSYVANVIKFNKGKCPPNWESADILSREVTVGGSTSIEYIYPYRPYLTGEEYLVSKVVREGIIPSNNKSSEMTNTELMVYTAIIEHNSLNLPLLIAKHMNFTITSGKSASLPYGVFVTWLMRKWGVEDAANVGVGKVVKVSLISQRRCGNFKLSFYDGHWRTQREKSELIEAKNGGQRVESPPRSRARPLDRVSKLEKKFMRHANETSRVGNENSKRLHGNLKKLMGFIGDIGKFLSCKNASEVNEQAFPSYPELEEPLEYPVVHEDVGHTNVEEEDDESGDDDDGSENEEEGGSEDDY